MSDSQFARPKRGSAGLPPVLQRRPWLAWVFCLAIFLSAFLLFQLQPLISKAILPWYGGSPAVWTTSMLFFQVLLFLGYAYAHWSTKWLPAVWQAIVYGCLIAVALGSLFYLFILPEDIWKPEPTAEPIGQILRLLTVHVGAPFFLLATSAPLIQTWWDRAGARLPYRLYALSNAGSLLALISYPLVIVPTLGLGQQAWLWSGGFAVVCGLLLTCAGAALSQPAHRASSRQPGASSRDDGPSRPTWRDRALWLFLPACGSALYLALTNHLCKDVAVVPLLWVVPLALYLLSFVLCFARGHWYHRGVFAVVMMVTMYLSAAFYREDFIENFAVILAIQLSALFSGCMVCHGELVRRKPPVEHLTSFYLHMSAGGAMGGLFVGVLAPLVMNDYYEYPLVLITGWLILLAVLFFDPRSRLRGGRPLWAWVGLALVFAGFVGLLSNGVTFRHKNVAILARNFYGTLKVRGNFKNGTTELIHGAVLHGSQYVAEDKKPLATTYYTANSGLGVALDFVADRGARRIGVVGLGVGTAAAHARDGDFFRFYEINPDVVLLAEHLFSFLSDAKKRGATCEIVLGDARLSLERDEDQPFDLLVVDAFSGDAVPAHLLSLEAVEVYLRHLKPGGLLAVHISNRYLDLLPVLVGAADHHDLDLVWIHHNIKEPGLNTSIWVLLARRGILNDLPALETIRRPRPGQQSVIWTDDYSNLFGILK